MISKSNPLSHYFWTTTFVAITTVGSISWTFLDKFGIKGTDKEQAGEVTGYVLRDGILLRNEPKLSAKEDVVMRLDDVVFVSEEELQKKLDQIEIWEYQSGKKSKPEYIQKLSSQKEYFLKVRFKGEERYLNLEDAIIREGVNFIRKMKPETRFIAATSLNFRETPSLKGKVLGQLKRGTEVTVTGEGILLSKIDNFKDIYLKASLADGRTGFVFRSYTVTSKQDLERGIPFAGNAYIVSNNPTIYAMQNGKLVKCKTNPCTGTELRLEFTDEQVNPFETEKLYKIESEVTSNGKKYYFLREVVYEMESSSRFEGYIEGKDIQIVQSVFEFTKAKYGLKEYANLYDKLRVFTGEDFDVRKMAVKDSFPIGKSQTNENLLGISFEKYSISGIIALQKGNAFTILTDKKEYAQNVSIFDMNDDGIPEVELMSSDRGGSSYHLLTFKNSKLVSLTKYNNFGYDEENGVSERNGNGVDTYSIKWENQQEIKTLKHRYELNAKGEWKKVK